MSGGFLEGASENGLEWMASQTILEDLHSLTVSNLCAATVLVLLVASEMFAMSTMFFPNHKQL
jgi:hypothetical protein